MPRPGRPALSVLVLGMLGLGCDQPAQAPSTETKPAPSTETKPAPSPSPETKTTTPDPKIPTKPETPPSPPASDDSGLELTSFEIEVRQTRPWVKYTAEVKLAREGGEFETLDFKAACRIGDAIHVATNQTYLGGKYGKQGTTIPLATFLFNEPLYDEGFPPGDCDFWLSSRVRRLHDGDRYQERLLAARCRRDGVLLDHGCAPLPSLEGKPLTASSLDISLTRPEVIADRSRGYELRMLVELTSKEAVGPSWKLEGDFECQVDGRPVHLRDDVLGVNLHELGPGQKNRHLASPNEALDAPPTQCELAIIGTGRMDDPHVPMGTWCYREGEPIRVGACPKPGT